MESDINVMYFYRWREYAAVKESREHIERNLQLSKWQRHHYTSFPVKLTTYMVRKKEHFLGHYLCLYRIFPRVFCFDRVLLLHILFWRYFIFLSLSLILSLTYNITLFSLHTKSEFSRRASKFEEKHTIKSFYDRFFVSQNDVTWKCINTHTNTQNFNFNPR